ncbi:phosphatase PAP2 family protein [Desulfurobacterium thermolithotrophum]|uniref:phosphatase PAP2 family protein n=1 Tax=Desulfurobacterium thermolithotrophum TaxID=64160 RepID=UPI0013D14806|nr:phosphatase PAP2 family protein [Desulfurobacterium thermolithotrophum]
MRGFFIFILWFSYVVNAFAGSSSNLLKTYKKDVFYTVKALKANKNSLLTFGGLLGVSFFLDKGTRTYVLNHQNTTLKNIADFTNYFGSGYILFPAVTALGTWGFLNNNLKLLEASITSFESGLTAELLTVGIKIAVGRERPYSTDNPFRFKPFKKDTLYHSFPSWHTVMAWSMITPYAVYYKQSLLYLIPLSVNFARVYKNKHWLSDTVMSSGIGFAVGYFFSKRHLSNRIVLLPSENNLMVGVRF